MGRVGCLVQTTNRKDLGTYAMRTDFSQDSSKISGNMGVEEVVEMGISKDALPYLAYAFSSIYNDPELAIIREYIANAIDATRDNGGKIEVIAPTVESPVFVVRDWGKGMSRDTVKKVYSQYFESTKNTSSNEIGGWGIGAMCAMATTNQFFVTTTKDDVTVKAQIVRPDYGLPDLNILSTVQGSGKPDGTVVSIPVSDVERFREKLAKFMFFENKKDIDFVNFPKAPTFSSDQNTLNAIEFEKVISIPKNDGPTNVEIIRSTAVYRIQRNFNVPEGFYIVMGGIYYSVPTEDIASNVDPEYRTAIDFMGNMVTIFDAPIDSVSLSPNREGVQFTSKTQNFIQDAVKYCYTELVETSQKSISDAPTYAEAVRKTRSCMPQVRSGIIEPLWNGFNTNNLTVNINDGSDIAIYDIDESYSYSGNYFDIPSTIIDGTSYSKIKVVFGSKSKASAVSTLKKYCEFSGTEEITAIIISGKESSNFDSIKDLVIRDTRNNKMTLGDFIDLLVLDESSIIPYQDILDFNREYRKKNKIKTVRVPAQQKRLDTHVSVWSVNGSGVVGRATVPVSDIIASNNPLRVIHLNDDNGTFIRANNIISTVCRKHNDYNDSYLILTTEQGDDIFTAKTKNDAVKMEVKNIEHITLKDLNHIDSVITKVVKKDIDLVIQKDLHSYINFHILDTIGKEDIHKIKDPVIRQIMENHHTSGFDRIDEIESSIDTKNYIGLSLTKTEQEFRDMLNISDECFGMMTYSDRFPFMKKYEEMETRMMFVRNPSRLYPLRVYSDTSKEHSIHHINADYDFYKKNRTKA